MSQTLPTLNTYSPQNGRGSYNINRQQYKIKQQKQAWQSSRIHRPITQLSTMHYTQWLSHCRKSYPWTLTWVSANKNY